MGLVLIIWCHPWEQLSLFPLPLNECFYGCRAAAIKGRPLFNRFTPPPPTTTHPPVLCLSSGILSIGCFLLLVWNPWILLADLVITGGINLFVGALPGPRLLPLIAFSSLASVLMVRNFYISSVVGKRRRSILQMETLCLALNELISGLIKFPC